MKRLQALEVELQQSVCISRDLVHFSDGWRLWPGFGRRPDTLMDRALKKERLMDTLHLDVLCGHGPMEIAVGADNFIFLGGADQLVTVRELLQGITKWCNEPFANSTKYEHFLLEGVAADENEPFLISMQYDGYNKHTQRQRYLMKIRHS